MKRRASRWPLALGLLLMGAALATMLWLYARLAESRDSAIRGTVNLFSATGVLGRPESREVVFEELETLARASENTVLRQVRVTKALREGGESTLFPFAADLTTPAWRDDLAWERLSVGTPPVGYLYLDINRLPQRAAGAVIATLAFMLAAGLAVLLRRQQEKEEELNRTRDELETRRTEVIRLERLALAGQLSANIFHDIRKPVLNIKHEVGDALEDDAPPSRELLRAVSEQTDLFLTMLRELGIENFVAESSQETEWVDLREAAEKALRLVRYERGAIECSVDFAEGPRYLIKASPSRLIQLFSNLALNAFQAMGEQGALTIRGRAETGHLIIDVDDTGPGIPPAKREEVFQPFVTSKGHTGGSGLGLYICRSIILDLGGSIVVDSSANGGARFHIELPDAP